MSHDKHTHARCQNHLKAFAKACYYLFVITLQHKCTHLQSQGLRVNFSCFFQGLDKPFVHIHPKFTEYTLTT